MLGPSQDLACSSTADFCISGKHHNQDFISQAVPGTKGIGDYTPSKSHFCLLFIKDCVIYLQAEPEALKGNRRWRRGINLL